MKFGVADAILITKEENRYILSIKDEANIDIVMSNDEMYNFIYFIKSSLKYDNDNYNLFVMEIKPLLELKEPISICDDIYTISIIIIKEKCKGIKIHITCRNTNVIEKRYKSFSWLLPPDTIDPNINITIDPTNDEIRYLVLEYIKCEYKDFIN